MQQERDAAKEMQKRYRNVFDTAEGRIVLGDILTLGHFGMNIDPNDPILVTEKNFAETIARTAGAFNEIYQHLGMTKGE
jgi:hypothetical protein